MPDMEKVIKGLKACAGRPHDCVGKKCPYFDTDECRIVLEKDALELLKEQQPKTGHWIEQEDYALDTYYDCSVCGESWSTVEGTPWENGMNYCPHCGAKMEGR